MLQALLIVTALLSSSISLSALIIEPSNITDNAISINSFSSAVFPLKGNIDSDEGYHVSMSIGNPPKTYFLDMDTGSSLTWLQCDAPCKSCWKGPHRYYKPRKGGLVKCRDAKCSWVPDPPLSHNRNCRKFPNRCDYKIQYADGLKSLGVFVTDLFTLKLSNNDKVQQKMLALGCGYDQKGAKKNLPVDGILGLGRGKASIISQLKNHHQIIKNIFGHCLSRKNAAGYLFFGDDLVPSKNVNWAPMTSIKSGNYYSIQKPSFYYGKKNLNIKNPAPVVFDSGSTLIYFTDQPYKRFLFQLENELKNKPLKRVTDKHKSDMVCWKGAKPFKSLDDVNKLFNILALKFGRVQYEIPPENYLIITERGNACLGILEGSKHRLNNLNLIGDIAMLNKMIIYDNEKHRIGWTKKNCDRNPSYIFPLPRNSDSLLEESFRKNQICKE